MKQLLRAMHPNRPGTTATARCIQFTTPNAILTATDSNPQHACCAGEGSGVSSRGGRRGSILADALPPNRRNWMILELAWAQLCLDRSREALSCLSSCSD